MRARLLLLVVLVACDGGSGGGPIDAARDGGARPDGPAGMDGRDAADGPTGIQSPCPFEGEPPMTFPIGNPCEAGWYRWVNRVCGPPNGDGSQVCGQIFGDGRCYQLCESDAECTDPAYPYCSHLGLHARGDSSCNQRVRICRCKRADDCPAGSLHHPTAARLVGEILTRRADAPTCYGNGSNRSKSLTSHFCA